ncbi:hypothetical protein [Streptomyces mirabilis]|uniref:hypothetical protein n=1 Tax=Streptomyces mirabilis TaxID=68239 RepID=UPI0033A7727A
MDPAPASTRAPDNAGARPGPRTPTSTAAAGCRSSCRTGSGDEAPALTAGLLNPKAPLAEEDVTIHKTVRRYRDTSFDALLASARDRRNVPLDRLKPYLRAEFAAGSTVATELYQQIRERGFRGGYSTLSRYVGTLRDGQPSRPLRPSAPHTITEWIMRPRENLPPRETHALEQVRLA